MTGAMRLSRAASNATPPNAAPSSQSLHPRSDENDAQPTPKKLKSEHRPRAQRRPALRDVTNEIVDMAKTAAPDSKSMGEKHARESALEARLEEGCDNQETTGSGDVEVDDDENSTGLVCETQQSDDEAFESNIEDLLPAPQSPELSSQTEAPLVMELPLDAAEDLATIQYRRLRETQMRNRVLEDYLVDQPQVNAKMRIILVNWLVDVHHRFKLESETLFLAVNYLDRYLTEATTTRRELQLVGLTSLFIAAKFEEVEALELSDLVYVCDETYTSDQIIEMERKILNVLSFNLATASTQAFLSHFTNALQCDRMTTLLAEYFAQNTLLQLPLLLCYSPSELAAASLFLAQCVAASERPAGEWISQWHTTTDCVFDDLLPCLHDLSTVMANPSKKIDALRHKFGTKRFGRVAQKPTDDLDAYL